MPTSQTRVVGSGFSVLRWQGQRIAFLENVEDSGQRPHGSVEAVQPLDEEYPIEFAVPKSAQAKTVLSSLASIKGFERLGTKKENAAIIALPCKDAVVEKSFRNFGNVSLFFKPQLAFTWAKTEASCCPTDYRCFGFCNLSSRNLLPS